MKESIYNLTRQGERKNIEFKENLNSKTHLFTERKQQLASQMKYRLERGQGEAIYFIGVDDDGNYWDLRNQKWMNLYMFWVKSPGI